MYAGQPQELNYAVHEDEDGRKGCVDGLNSGEKKRWASVLAQKRRKKDVVASVGFFHFSSLYHILLLFFFSRKREGIVLIRF
jgi:hypothetical protein